MAALPSIASADAYHSARANAAWAALITGNKTAALYRAQDYIFAMYTFADDTDEDDALIQTATIMLAGELIQPVALTSATAGIVKQTKSLDGVGSTSVEYDSAAGDPYPLVTASLRSILASAPGASVRCAKLVI